MKLLITGSRDWPDYEAVLNAIKACPNVKLIIQGGATGADSHAKQAANALGIECHEEPADWDTHGKAAGPIRNAKMVDTGPDLVLAFSDDLENSKGTKGCVKLARAAGINVILHYHKKNGKLETRLME